MHMPTDNPTFTSHVEWLSDEALTAQTEAANTRDAALKELREAHDAMAEASYAAERELDTAYRTARDEVNRRRHQLDREYQAATRSVHDQYDETVEAIRNPS
jgi:hypothetical protein